MKHISEGLAAVALCALIGWVVYLMNRPPETIIVGLDCKGEVIRVYGDDDGAEASKACRTVEIHKVP